MIWKDDDTIKENFVIALVHETGYLEYKYSNYVYDKESCWRNSNKS